MDDSMIDILQKSARIYKENGDFKKTCPNCGAAIEGDQCKYCGTLFVDFACIETDTPCYIKVKYHGKIIVCKVRMTEATLDYADRYLSMADGDRIAFQSNDATLDLKFLLLE